MHLYRDGSSDEPLFLYRIVKDVVAKAVGTSSDIHIVWINRTSKFLHTLDSLNTNTSIGISSGRAARLVTFHFVNVIIDLFFNEGSWPWVSGSVVIAGRSRSASVVLNFSVRVRIGTTYLPHQSHIQTYCFLTALYTPVSSFCFSRHDCQSRSQRSQESNRHAGTSYFDVCV